MTVFESIASALGQTPGGEPRPIGGGCIHRAFQWGDWFIKANTPDHHAAFASESAGLQALAEHREISTPGVVASGSDDHHAWLVLELLDLKSSGDEALLGEQLAALHGHPGGRFGFGGDNFIGSTPQPNVWSGNWADFFRDQRISPMFDRLAGRGTTFSGADRLLGRLTDLLPHHPPASLLHGDLWSGNKAFLRDDSPVLYDPAVYHGHAAAEIAMTTLFGGFSRRFYDAYRSSCDLDAPELHEIYNLYHVLNHALLFGGGYVRQARATVERFG